MKQGEFGPHICGICMKGFDRRDLRDRHKRRCAVKKPKVSKQRSCVSCARSKLRCNLGFPSCERCVDRRTYCEYPSLQSEPGQHSSESQFYESPDYSYSPGDVNYSASLGTPYEEELLGLSPAGSYSAEEQMEPWNPTVGNATTSGYPSTDSFTRFSTDFSGGLSRGGMASTGSDLIDSGPHFSNNPHTHSATFPNYEHNLHQQIGNPAYLSTGHANPGIDYRSAGQYYSTTAAGYGTQELVPSFSHYPTNQPHTTTRQSTITTSSLPAYRNTVPVNPSTQPSGNLMVNAGYYSAPTSHHRAYSQPESHTKRTVSESQRRYR